ncbi:MAG TPA: GNAT family N-acetyltransferase [Candidatus Xenobia bacterium]|jgi:nitroimidazol reductase NimA-like FMN-containing flavoprotein (pyridoxamine 5'-phosphate oxidase superfamily)/GNAT superfamily N-acetyltransferase
MTTTLRRKEFQSEDLWTVLDEARYGHLAVDGPDVRALNYARQDDTLYFHCAEGGEVGGWSGREACFAVETAIQWIPSYWRHPEMACPASTWYRSAMVRGRLREVTDLLEKGIALQAFMDRYQPEGGHRPIRGDDDKYRGPLSALRVMALRVESSCCKVKMGQHLPAPARRTILQHLEQRGDWRTWREMARANEDLPELYPQTDEHGLEWRDGLECVPIEAAWKLLQTTYWAEKRDIATVGRKLAQAGLVLTAWDGNELIALCRVVTVDVKDNWLYDVVIAPQRRGQGIGQALMRRILKHPALAEVERLFLDTRDAMSLYAKFGFVELYRRNNSTFMVLDRRETAPQDE